MKRFIGIFCVLLMAAGIFLGVYRLFFHEEPEVYPDPTVVITLSDGSVLNAVLYPSAAPNTVANFVELAKAGFYDGLEIHRVVPGVLIQTGDPAGDGTGGAGYYIHGEFSANGYANPLSHTRGAISMSRQPKGGYNTASSQFFIMQGSFPEYDGQYAVFGALTDEESLLTLDEIGGRPVDGNHRPLNRIFVRTIEVDTHGAEYHALKIEQEEET